jgi:flagellar hook-associated protein 2
MSTSTFAPITLNGVSQYSSDLQNVLGRAVAIAQIPITALQNKDADVLTRSGLLSTLSGAASELAASMQALGTVAASQGLAATSSNTAAVTVSNAGSTVPATYTIDSVTSAASAASERSLNPYMDSAATPVSSTGTMQLNVGATPYKFTLTANNLVTLRDTINGLGAGVSASILTTSGGNYLSITANATGNAPLSLVDDPGVGGANTPWLTAKNPGTNAVFQLDGINIVQSGNTVNNAIGGVSFTIVGPTPIIPPATLGDPPTTTPVTLTLQSDPTQLSSALQDLATKYNAVRQQLNAQEGPAAGLLRGDTAVTQMESLMRQIAGYTTTSPTGQTSSLADLGIEFDTAGNMSFVPTTTQPNQIAFDTLTAAQISAGFKFIGSATTGFAGLSQSVQEMSDPIQGLFKIETDGFSTTDKSYQSQITTLTDRLTTMQASLASQLQKADSMLAQLANQQSTLSGSLLGLSLVTYGKDPTGA